MSHGVQLETAAHFGDPEIASYCNRGRLIPGSFSRAACRQSVLAWLAAAPSPAAAALPDVAPGRIPIRAAHIVCRVGIAAASVGRTAAAIPHDPTSLAHDGGAAAAPARRADLTAVARTAETRGAKWTESRHRVVDVSTIGTLADPAASLLARVYREQRRLASAASMNWPCVPTSGTTRSIFVFSARGCCFGGRWCSPGRAACAGRGGR